MLEVCVLLYGKILYCHTTFPLPRSQFGIIIVILEMFCLINTKISMKTIKIENIRILCFKNLTGLNLENALILFKHLLLLGLVSVVCV